jgi:UDP-N-acetylglucosamine:LPS N-acetylglucosamine transferase
MAKEKLVLIVAGVGGHEAQAKILKNKLYDQSMELKVELICEASSMTANKSDHSINSSSRLAKKLSWFRVLLLMPVLVANVFQICRIIIQKKRHFDVALVSLGPFPAIPSFIASKICGTKFVSIESRSRIESISASNKLLLMMKAQVFVQHSNTETRSRKLKHIGVLR